MNGRRPGLPKRSGLRIVPAALITPALDGEAGIAHIGCMRPSLSTSFLRHLPAAVALALGLVLTGGCDLPVAPGSDRYIEELVGRKGRVVAVEVGPPAEVDGLILTDFRITSTTGLVVRGRLRVPSDATADDPRPLVVLLGGIERGGHAIDLIPPGLPHVGAALWYPEALGAKDAADALTNLDRLTDVALDIPASILLALDHLVELSVVDPARVAVVGASFGGFFAPAAAASDLRIANVGLLYAGGDLAGLLAAHLEEEVPPAAAMLGAEMAALRLQRLEPTRYMSHIAPRPVLLVNGRDDDLVVRESAEALIRAARPPKDVVWLPTGHLDPDNEAFLQELVDTALSRLPVLRWP